MSDERQIKIWTVAENGATQRIDILWVAGLPENYPQTLEGWGSRLRGYYPGRRLVRHELLETFEVPPQFIRLLEPRLSRGLTLERAAQEEGRCGRERYRQREMIAIRALTSRSGQVLTDPSCPAWLRKFIERQIAAYPRKGDLP